MGVTTIRIKDEQRARIEADRRKGEAVHDYVSRILDERDVPPAAEIDEHIQAEYLHKEE